jgi:hypothetical protein
MHNASGGKIHRRHERRRDSMGRVQATQTTDRYGKTTYRDAQGRVQGTKK